VARVNRRGPKSREVGKRLRPEGVAWEDATPPTPPSICLHFAESKIDACLIKGCGCDCEVKKLWPESIVTVQGPKGVRK
jgi:hypothetical protein